MARSWLRVLCPLSFILFVAHPVLGQSAGTPRMRVGVSAGADALPVSVRDACGSAVALEGGSVLSVRVSARLLGPVGLEARAGVHSGKGGVCVHQNQADGGLPTNPPLTLVSQYSTAAPKPYRSLDVKLRLNLDDAGHEVITVGPGILAGGPFYWSGAARYLWGRTARYGLEMDVMAIRVPWTTQTIEVYQNPNDPGQLLFGAPRLEPFERWQLGFAVSAVLELPIP
ncbi:MAG: hypothetical protein LJF06_00155 [Gemmatimonadetes bacterium]|nr:hypothetical protein [Gemmatimonadota bacterium]